MTNDVVDEISCAPNVRGPSKNTQIPDSEGLICAFRFRTESSAEVFGWNAISDSPGSGGGPVWIHVSLTDTRARRWLEERAHLPEAAREGLFDPEPRVHAQTLSDGLVVVLSDLHHDFRADPEGIGTLHIYLDQDRVISGRRHALRSVDHLRRALLAGLRVTTTMGWLEELVLALAETTGDEVAKLSNEVDTAEDKVLAGRLREQGTTLGRIRRLLARLRRHIGANRSALARVLSHMPPWSDAESRSSLRQAADHLETVAQDIELVQERTRLLQEEIAARLGEATNRNLFLLSMLTATFLPVTLITGIFGMNVGGLPWLEDSSGFAWVSGIMISAAAVTLLLLRKTRLF